MQCDRTRRKVTADSSLDLSKMRYYPVSIRRKQNGPRQEQTAWHDAKVEMPYTATLSLIPSLGAWTRSCFVPR